ncbi:hypothetical protein PAHAL_2G423600 [Panicum hallii]|uniref:DUF946 domain-containing protein n=1 Tax=Panicum hallii TaxID=206008 RepID=A0A2T8KSE6_9POAL|nr:uncharacterized protein LOC112881918 isoform X1 [Panicum hallii]XP_025802631.1 uncharacterized protein LOC112881918 isoform X1 [Panicum hallii]PVH65101.1 hypothetical protein PAHAL_2G423600 [Panicum hallii]
MRRSRSCFSCVPMGTAALPIEKHFVPPAALPSWPASAVSDGGFAKGSIDLGGLEVRQITTFDKVWSTTQGGQDGVGATFFKPSPVPAGFSVLGHYAQPNNRPLFGHVLVARDTSGTGAFLAAPVDYKLVWSSPDGAGHFWLPASPDGYKAVGTVVTATSDKPSANEVRCVRADFTDACETEESVLSSDKDSFSTATLRPAVRGIDARGVHAGTFLAQSSATPANASTLACLKNNSASYTSSMPDLAQVNSLLAAYAPHVYLHPNEPYLPSSVTWFFENGALLHQNGSQTPKPVAADGSNLPQGGGNDGGYWLDLPVDSKQREKVKKGDLAGAKVYVQAKPMLGGTVTDLAVWIFYPFNGPARAKVGLLTIPLGEIGEHVGDWEHVTLRVSNFSGELLRMYFSQHSAGTWVEASQLEYLGGDGGNRPVAYASLHGHAMYPKAGLVLQGDARLGVGIRNDCARGSRLDTGGAGRCEVVSAEYLGVAEPAWLGFEREWGPREEYDIGREINRVARILPRSARERLAKLVEKVLVGDGPTGPKMHGNWRNDEREA